MKKIKKSENKKSKLQAKLEDDGKTLMGIGKIKTPGFKQKLAKIWNLKKKFFSEHDKDKKKLLKKEINKLEWKLIEVTLKKQGNEKALDKLKNIKKIKQKMLA
ncbi:MAG: hypothetical protein KJ771_08570 [Nanoarchaeota archaeon]|nr:hypothetical protein [Nanoarchaeota archaeon]